MKIFYATNSWINPPQITEEETLKRFARQAEKKNWRIVQLPNGYYQTEFVNEDGKWLDVTRRETIEEAEETIDKSVLHYQKRLALSNGPIVVKTFE